MKREKICRICLCDAEELKSLQDKFREEQKSILEAVNFVVNINMELKKDLPDKICNECVTALEMADIFKRRCLDSEKNFGQYHTRLEKEEFFEEVPFTCEKQSLDNVVGKLLKKEDDFAVYANVTISKSKKSETNLQTIEPDITETKDDGTLTVKIESEPFGNDFDNDTEHLDNNAACDLDAASKQPTKSKIQNAVQGGNVKKNNGTALREEKEKFPCILCGAAYVWKNSLKKHIARKHPHCKNKYDLKFKLNGHKSTVPHTENQMQLCTICGKWMTVQGLAHHILRHKNIRAFQCDYCQKSFVTKSELRTHIRSHTGDQPFLCGICGRGFTTTSSMLTHRRKHSDARPFVCEYCPKSFKLANDLKRHTRTHTGEKPYKCTVCEAAFNRSHQLTGHMRRHARDTPNIEALMAAAIRKSGRPPCLSGIK